MTTRRLQRTRDTRGAASPSSSRASSPCGPPPSRCSSPPSGGRRTSGGWPKQLLEPEALFAAAALGAAVATVFTFLPSFLFILAGGPLVERTRDDVAFAAPLTAITAAVVGVVVNLAVFFAWR